MYIYILFHILFYYGLSQNIEYSSLCYIVRKSGKASPTRLRDFLTSPQKSQCGFHSFYSAGRQRQKPSQLKGKGQDPTASWEV